MNETDESKKGWYVNLDISSADSETKNVDSHT